MQVAFYKGRKRLFDRITTFWLRGPYSHCELVINTDANGVSICASSSFMDGGVRIKHMRMNPAHWDLVDVGGEPLRAWAWVAAHEEQGYDLLGLFGFVARALKQDKSRWFCSEAVAEMLNMADSWRFDPCSLWAALSLYPNRQPVEATP